MSFRAEKDTLGVVNVPKDKYWGAQTERSRNNFKIVFPVSFALDFQVVLDEVDQLAVQLLLESPLRVPQDLPAERNRLQVIFVIVAFVVRTYAVQLVTLVNYSIYFLDRRNIN